MRNAITRDLMTTMYTFMLNPDKNFCTSVANKLVQKYSFMRDVNIDINMNAPQSKKSVEEEFNKLVTNVHLAYLSIVCYY